MNTEILYKSFVYQTSKKKIFGLGTHTTLVLGVHIQLLQKKMTSKDFAFMTVLRISFFFVPGYSFWNIRPPLYGPFESVSRCGQIRQGRKRKVNSSFTLQKW